jgi:hypothetical protein
MRVIAGLTLSVLLLGACLLADPPGDPPKSDPRRPSIQHEAVDPPLFLPITDIPPGKELVVPVDSDPQAPLTYKLFLDFDPVTGGVPLIPDSTIPPDQTLNPTRVIHIGLSSLFGLDTSQCHTLLLRVAVDFSTKSNWTPLPPGGDDAIWFYRPNGAQGPCPGFDAGTFPDASAFDTGADE